MTETLEFPKLLIVEDNEDDVTLLVRKLGKANVRFADIDVAIDSVSAKEKLMTSQYDLVIMDYMLPDGNAKHILGELHEQAEGVILPCLAVTIADDRRIAVELMKLGVYDFICKDELEPKHLRKKIEYVVRRCTEDRVRESYFSELSNRVLFDDLTGLPNRNLLNDRIEHAIRTSRRDDTKFAVLFADLDNFKDINDAHGHSTGDAVLIEVARRLSEASRDSDTVARLCGDEFVIVLPNVFLPANVRLVVQKLRDSLEAPLKVDGHLFRVSASIGFSIFPDDGEDVRAIIHRADLSMYDMKNSFKQRNRA